MQIEFIKRHDVEILGRGFLALFKAGFGRAIMMSSCRRKIRVKRRVLIIMPGLEEKLSINRSQVK